MGQHCLHVKPKKGGKTQIYYNNIISGNVCENAGNEINGINNSIHISVKEL